MKYVVLGLGNPTEEYVSTRHNVGKDALIDVAKKMGAESFVFKKVVKLQESKLKIGKHAVTFLLPEVYMNVNGKVLTPYIKTKKDAERLVVLYDDLDLPLGKMKMSFGRSSGGHKGLESVIKTIKTKDFLRIRIGVSPASSKGVAKKPSGEDAVIAFILGHFKDSELDVLKKLRGEIAEGIETFVREGKDAAMNRFN